MNNNREYQFPATRYSWPSIEEYLFMLWLKLTHVSKPEPWSKSNTLANKPRPSYHSLGNTISRFHLRWRHVRVIALQILTVFNSIFILITNKTPKINISYPLSLESTEVMLSISRVPYGFVKCFSWYEWRYRRDLSDLFRFYFQKPLRLFEIKFMPL